MKLFSFRSLTLLTGLSLAGASQAAVMEIADAAGDYVAAAGSTSATLAAPPTGWSYLGSTLANGGTESALNAGQVGDQGAAYQGFEGVSIAGTAAVYGTNTADPNEYEIFGNGDANGGVVGTDLLLHSGQAGNADEYVIVRYTISASDVVDLNAGAGAISGSFRELVVGGGAAAQSVAVEIFHNSDSVFSTAGGTTAQNTPNILTQADGTFNITGRTFLAGDTIDFVVSQNGHFGADETALTASITGDYVPEPSSLAIIGLGGLALMRRRRA